MNFLARQRFSLEKTWRSIMVRVVEYRTRAAACAREVAETNDLDKREQLLRTAQGWIALAENERWLGDNTLTVAAQQRQVARSC
jgi:hypothetical protein